MTLPAVLAELRALVTQRMAGIHAALLDQADDALFDLASRSSASRDQQDYLDAMRELRRERAAVTQRLRESLLADFDSGPSEPVAAEQPPDQLSLVAVDDLELQLAGERLAATLERQYGRSLHGLAQAMLKVSGQARPPLSPLALAKGLTGALSSLHIPLTGQLVILKLFERQLGSEFGNLLNQLIKKLSEHGIELPRDGVRAGQPVRPASRPAARADAESADPVSTTADSESEDDSWTPETVERRDQNELAEDVAASGSIMLLHALRDMFSSYFGGSDKSNGNGHLQGEATAAVSAATTRMGEATSAAARSTPGGAQLDHRPAALAAEQVLAALAYMQQHPPAGLFRAVDDRSAELGDLLKFELLHCARDTLGLSIAGGLRQADAQGLTLVGMLFDVLLDQGDFSDAVRRQLIAVSVPYTKVALLDQQMFAHRTHPARRLLNMLADACDGNQGETRTERELLMRVEAVIKRLNKEFDRDTEIFNELEQRFARVMEQRVQRSRLVERRTAESLQGRERLEDARLTASLEVSSLMGGHQVPEAIEQFVRRDWSHHLAMVLLREGEDSQAFRNARRIGVDLMIAVHACALGAPIPQELGAKLKPVMQSTGRHSVDDILQAMQTLHGAPPSTVANIDRVGGDSPADQQAIQRRLLAMREQRAKAAGLAPRAPTTDSAAPAARAGAEPTAPVAASSNVNTIDQQVAASAQDPAFEIVETATVVAGGSPELNGDLALEIDATQVSPADIERVNRLKPGQWVDLIDAHGVQHAAKLSWISPLSQRILFVNRGGTRLCLLSPPEAAALITQGKLRSQTADQPFDRALVNVMARIRENVELAHPKE
ncbi:DUF1631 family protein [Pseudomarimonas arenosa]|uniref:DUF1631 family protein n=1 Tax=Pseudomarimonas arenosa TaxID=2774145 RepID=A0AAW3ZNB1_9GAMM|nr:DUF1631 family protein [Pseudomarimonas arenosa]MBD8525786.1 DUF1631 family protein [Pseudomarimonas arenosa]